MTIVTSDARYDVSPGPGVYYVVQLSPGGAHTYIVGKDKTCSCGGSKADPCRHIEAVAAYLKRGGARAPEADTEAGSQTSRRPAVVSECPICGADVRRNGRLWTCTENSNNAHYWQWRGGKVRDFLTQPRPNKLGPFYEQTPEERRAFLDAAQRRMRQYRRGVYA